MTAADRLSSPPPSSDVSEPALLPQQVLLGMPMAVFALNREAQLTFANPQALHLLGLATAPLGLLQVEVLPAHLPEELLLALHRAASATEPVSGEYFLPHCQRWVEMSTQPTGPQVLVYWQDITRLVQQRQQYQAMADVSPNAVARWSPGLRLQYANAALGAAAGQPPGALLGKALTEINLPTSLDGAYSAKLQHVFATGKPEEYDHSLATPNGEQQFHSRLVPEVHAGQVLAVLAITHNITALQPEEAELRARKDLLEAIFNRSTLALHLLRSVRDGDGRILDFEVVLANALADELAGRPLLGRRMLVDWPYAREMGLFDGIVRAVETGQLLDLESSFDADGASGWFRWTAVQLGDGAVVAIENITVRKQSEQAMRESKDLLHAIFNATLDSLEVLQGVRDEAGALVDFEWLLTNEASHRLLQRRTMVGHRLLIEEPNMVSCGVFAHFCQVVEQQQPLNFELPYPEQNSQTWYHVAAAPFGDGLVVTWHDITARKRATADLLRLQLAQQQQLANAVLEAQEVERRRIAEALHNGLGQLLYAAQLQLDQLLTLTDAAAFASGHRKTLELLKTAISQTRTLSHELIPTILEDFGLAVALRQICRDYSSPSLHLTCHSDNLPPLPPALALALYRMAQELANNIVKHAHATEATLSLHSRAGWLELQARDNGRGFDPAQPPTQEGMGLQALRDRVKLLNGQFRIRSSPKNGTLVNILIPQAANPR